MSGSEYVEPWLRGTITDVHPVIAQVLYSFTHALEDLQRFASGLTVEQLWAAPAGMASVGFHIRHIGGSVDRLVTYMRQRALSDEQLRDLQAEKTPGEDLDGLLRALSLRFASAERELRQLTPLDLDEPRTVGRKRLPTSVGGLVVHLAEHTQRHVGQAITTAKFVRSS